MDKYHENKIFFYIILSVVLHAGVLYTFFKGHSISGLMGSLGNSNLGGQYNDQREHDIYANNMLDNRINGVSNEVPDIENANARLDKSPNKRPKPNTSALEIVNIKKSKPALKPKVSKPHNKKAQNEKPKKELPLATNPKPELKPKPQIENTQVAQKQTVQEAPSNLEDIETQNLVAPGKELTPEIIDLDPIKLDASNQDVMVIAEKQPAEEKQMAKNNPENNILNPMKEKSDVQEDATQPDIVQGLAQPHVSPEPQIAIKPQVIEKPALNNFADSNLIDSNVIDNEPINVERDRVEIPKQLSKVTPEPESELSFLSNKSDVYDSNDSLLGVHGNYNINATNNEPINNNSGGNNFALSNNRDNMPGNGMLGEDMLGEGMSGGVSGMSDISGISNEDVKIFREGEIIPLVGAAPIDYPKQSLALAEEGSVKMDLLFDKFGHLVNIKITKSSGFIRLDEAAKNAVQGMRFRATGVPFVYQPSFDFELEKN